MKVQVAYADADRETIVDLDVDDACTAQDAVLRSGVLHRVAVPHEQLSYAIYGHRVDADAALSPGDRVELTRPLARDAKAARRARAKK